LQRKQLPHKLPQLLLKISKTRDMLLPDADRLASWRSFLTAHAAMNKLLTHALEEEEGLQLPWFEILDALAMAEDKSLRFNELAERVMANPSSLSRQIDRLEKKKLVAREKSVVDDGRATVLVLTPRGHDAWQTASATYYRIVRRVFTSWLTETDVIALNRVFGKVLEAD
jgi:DNA-binding MarR family transcriptional regulator